MCCAVLCCAAWVTFMGDGKPKVLCNRRHYYYITYGSPQLNMFHVSETFVFGPRVLEYIGLTSHAK